MKLTDMKKIALTLLFAALAMTAIAGDKEVEDLLAKMRKAYKDVKTATFTLESTLLADNGDIVITLTGGFKSPNKMYVDIEFDDMKMKVISDGKRIYVFNPLFDEIRDIPYNDERMGRALSAADLELINFYDWELQLSTEKEHNMNGSKLSIRKDEEWNGKKWIVLEESAPQVNVYVEYYIDPKTHLIWRTVRMDIDKEFIRGDYVLKKLKTGVKIDDKKFKKPVITLTS